MFLRNEEPMERILSYPITSADAGQTMLSYLKSHGYSRQNITALKKMPQSTLIDGKWEYMNHLLKSGELLTIHIRETEENEHIIPVFLPFSIVYEDEDLLVINKPADMPTHPSIHNYDNTLANAVSYYYHSQGIAFTFRCINRLDRDTTGLTIIAKHMLSAGILSGMAAKQEIRKEYLALVYSDPDGQSDHSCVSHDRAGHALSGHGTIDAPIARTGDSIIKRRVDAKNGERAVTHYQLIQQKNGYALISLHLETGRTHQIRVHMSSVGHPLLGDDLYGGGLSLIGRQALHCHRMSFTHPITHKALRFTAPLPSDMQKLLTVP